MVVLTAIIILVSCFVDQADAYTADNYIYATMSPSTFTPTSGNDFTITLQLTNFDGVGIAGKAAGIKVKSVKDQTGAKANTTCDGKGFTDIGGGYYTKTCSITDADGLYYIEGEFKDPDNKKLKSKPGFGVTLGGPASSTEIGINTAMPEFIYYPLTGQVRIRYYIENQDGSPHTGVTYSNNKAPNSIKCHKFESANKLCKPNVTYPDTLYDYGNGVYDLFIDYNSACNDVFNIGCDFYVNDKVKFDSYFAIEINDTQAPVNPTGTPPQNPLMPSVTLAVIADFSTNIQDDHVVVHWKTSSENETTGFHLLRRDRKSGRYEQVNKQLLPGLIVSPQGGEYSFIDEEAPTDRKLTYKLVEIENDGTALIHGPYTVRPMIKTRYSEKGEKKKHYKARARDTSREMHNRLEEARHEKERTKTARKHRKHHADGDKDKRHEKNDKQQLKIVVRADGIYFLGDTEIADNLGLSPKRVRTMIRKGKFVLRNSGKTVAYLAAQNGAGLYFFGRELDDLYTDENVYWLGRGKGRLMEVEDGDDEAEADKVFADAHFNDSLHVEQQKFTTLVPGTDYWMWDYFISDTAGPGKDFSFQLEGVAATGDEATLTVTLMGATEIFSGPDHHAQVMLNGTVIGETYFDAQELRQATFSFSQELLREGGNTLTVRGILDTGAPYSIFYLDSFDLTYGKRYRAYDNRLSFRAGDNSLLTVDGFSEPVIYLFDITDLKQPKLVRGFVSAVGPDYRVSFEPEAGAEYYAVTVSALLPVTDVWLDTPSSLKSRKNEADYLVIAPPELLAGAGKLAAYRREQGMDTMVVNLDDIMDEFNDGRKSPEAITQFLALAWKKWRRPPRYIVLAGNGTVDYRDYLQLGGNLIPPLLLYTHDGYFPSDSLFADVDGDLYPEMAVGRLPVLTNDELENMVDKIIRHETVGSRGVETVLMLADDSGPALNFPADSDEVAQLVPQGYTVKKIYLSDKSTTAAREELFTAFDDGALLMNYIGHGGLDRLADEGFVTHADTGTLGSDVTLPVLTAMTCMAGYFAIPGYESLGVGLVRSPDAGVIAAWVPSGLSYNRSAQVLNKGFFRAAFGDDRPVLGDVVMQAVEAYRHSGHPAFLPAIYNILGDPGLRMW